jgi:hypothetical protein
MVTAGSVNYCATVDAQSPYAAYNGRQAYIVETQMSGNRVSSAVIGLIAGGKDFAIVTNMCAKYGLRSEKRQLGRRGLLHSQSFLNSSSSFATRRGAFD